MNTSTQFYTTNFFISLFIGLGYGQCEHTIAETEAETETETNKMASVSQCSMTASTQSYKIPLVSFAECD